MAPPNTSNPDNAPTIIFFFSLIFPPSKLFSTLIEYPVKIREKGGETLEINENECYIDT